MAEEFCRQISCSVSDLLNQEKRREMIESIVTDLVESFVAERPDAARGVFTAWVARAVSAAIQDGSGSARFHLREGEMMDVCVVITSEDHEACNP